MVFASNPLSLSVPDPAFESWLRSSGHLETLDHRTSQLHTLPSTAAVTTKPPPIPTYASILSHVRTLLSLFTINPFAKVTTEDLAADTPAWTHAFVGSAGGYTWPASPDQARIRVHENLKRYVRNYAALFVLFLACSLYQIPFALVGLILSLAIWDGLRFCGDRWGLDQRPIVRKILVHIAQCGTACVLLISNVQKALLCALGVGYIVMILHASFRKLSPTNKPARSRR